LSPHPCLLQALEDGVFPITKRIAIGQFASEERCCRLIDRGVTHVLNVSDCESLASTAKAGFRKVIDFSVADLARIPDEHALRCLDTIHGVMSEPGSKLYIHCTAGQNRSPTVLWLYLVACGMEAGKAKHLIVERCPDAVPGHGSLVDDELIAAVRIHGSGEFCPLEDPAILQPAY
jgi:protein-tyrosine phosphatase